MPHPTPPPFFILKGHSGSISTVQFTNEKDDIFKHTPTLISGSDVGEIFIWDLQSFRTLFRLFDCHEKKTIMCLKYHKSTLISQGKDSAINTWNYNNEEWIVTRKLTTDFVGFCASVFWVAKDSTFITLVTQDKHCINVFDIDTENEIMSLPWNSSIGMCMCIQVFTIKEKFFLLTGYENGSIGLWDYETNSEIHSLKCHKDIITCLDFDSQHKMTGISGSSDEFVKVWKINKEFQLEQVRQLTLTNQGINAVKIRDDGKIVIIAGWDFNIRVYSWKTLKPLAILRFHTLAVNCLAYSSVPVSKQNSVFATGSKDKNIALWSLY